MLIKKSPRSVWKFNNSSISISIDQYKEVALDLDDSIEVEISSQNIEEPHDLPNSKIVLTTREYILKEAKVRSHDGDVYYTIQFPEDQEVKGVSNNSNKTQYIVFEGEEGTGKTTQTSRLAQYLRDRGFSVLETKEPGTQHLPLTMALRKIMLDGQYENQITATAREFISQSIRSIHLEKLVYPAVEENKYDFIIQDRGILSGLAYGTACGNNTEWLTDLAECVSDKNEDELFDLYDHTIYLTGNTEAGLQRALASKQEFEAGDAMEARGNEFMNKVSENFQTMSQWFYADTINIDNKSIDEVFGEILHALELA